MPYTEFDGKTTFVRQKLTSSALNAIEQGVQDELEERQDALSLPGVVTGAALSISSTNILIAAGTIYVDGHRFTPAASAVAFSASNGAGTYYIYVDPSNHTTPYTKSTVSPGAGYLLLGQVAWDGASVLSSLVDYRRMGLIYHEVQMHISGALSGGEDAMAIHGGGTDGRSFWVEGVKGLLEETGSAAGPTYLSAYAGAGGSETALWTTGSRRVIIQHADANRAVATSGEPQASARTVAIGQVIRVRVDQAATGAQDAHVVVYGRLL